MRVYVLLAALVAGLCLWAMVFWMTGCVYERAIQHKENAYVRFALTAR